MSKFLDDFLVTMPSTQRQKLIELLELKKKEGLIRTSHELERELERMMVDIESREGGPTFKAREQSGRIDSSKHNENMDEILFDLVTLFEASANIDRLMSDNKQLSRSLLSGIKKQINTLKSKLERYKLLMKNTDSFVDGIHEQFDVAEYTETDERVLSRLRKDRFDKYLGPEYNAENMGDALQLSGLTTTDQLQTNYGRRMADIEIINRTGHANSNPEHGIEKAIDGSLDTFWAENVLVDQAITQDISDLWDNSYSDYPKDGAVCEMQITLNGITTVSDIQFDPYCAFPLEIVSIYGYETEDMGGEMYELISPNHENPHQRSKKSVNVMNFQFPSVDISKLRLLIRQENYVKENYIVNEEDKQNMELWRNLYSDQGLMDDYKKPNETIAEFDKKNEITGWNVYLENLIKWGESVDNSSVVEAAKVAMETVRMGDYKNPLLLKLIAMSPEEQEIIDEDPVLSQSWSAVNKLSYLYGAYNISVFGRKYRSHSVYITEPLPLSSNARVISLDTEEKHHDISIGPEVIDPVTGNEQQYESARITDIEYYISHKKNPSAKEWIPILPIDKKYVRGELLSGDLIQGTPPEFEEHINKGDSLISYSFRFPVVSDKTVVLRRNGIVMDPTTYMISHDGRKIAILNKFYNASSIYTVDYKPHDDSWFVELNEDTDVTPTQYIDNNGETGEYFSTVDQDRVLELKHKPYLFRNSLYEYDEDEKKYDQNNDKLSSKTPDFPMIVRVNGQEYKNITNYLNNSYDEDRLSENEGKTFAQINNNIIFGKPINGDKIENVTVDYYYVATDIRMKAILRRNSVEDESVTPALYSYNIRCQSYDQEA